MSRFLTKVMLWNHTKMPFLHEAIWSPSGRRHLNTSIVWRNSIVFLIHLLGNHSQVKLGWTMYTFSNKIWNRILIFLEIWFKKDKNYLHVQPRAEFLHTKLKIFSEVWQSRNQMKPYLDLFFSHSDANPCFLFTQCQITLHWGQQAWTSNHVS